MILQSFKMSIKSICSNKLRSFLTMLGIIIGVFSLVVLVSLVNGTTGSITDSINALGSNYLSVTVSDDLDNPIYLDELSEVTALKEIDSAAPVSELSVTASSSYAEESSIVIGTTSPYAEIRDLKLASGRFLLSPDNDNHTDVAVISADLATEVMGRTDVVGECIKLDGREFQIIGVLEDDTASLTSTSQQSQSFEAYIPYTSLIRLTDSVNTKIKSFCVSAPDDNMDAAESALDAFLLERFHDEDSYTLFNQASIAEAMDSVTNTLALLLGGIAGISLLVGGIGIMNIMLVSVAERTREIGIRKAIGAGRGVIMLQFLMESLMISIIGCLIGIVVSWAALQIINILGNVSYQISPGVALLSIAFSLGIGVLFGSYPANKAAKMDPINALRFS